MAEATLTIPDHNREEPPFNRVHQASLDGLRGAAALYVMFHHITTSLLFPNVNVLQRVLGVVFKFGHYPVDVFIVLSGFCLTIPVCRSGGVLKGGAKHFFRRRAHRILPTYFAAIACSLLLIWIALGSKTGTHWDVTIPVTWKDLLEHVLLVQDLFPKGNHTINYAMWSISVEWRIYFLFPLFLLASRRFGSATVAVVAVLASYLLLFFLRFTPVNTESTGASPAYIGLFCLGMLGCEMSFGKLRGQVDNPLHFKLFLALGSALLAVISFSRFHDHAQMLSLLVGLLSAALMISLTRGYLPAANRLFSWKPVAALGTIGYSLYLFHPPLIQLVWVALIRPFNLAPQVQQLLLVASAPLIVGGCYVAFLLFEQPVLKSLARKKPPSPSPVS